MPKKQGTDQAARKYEPLDVLAFIVTYRERNQGWSPSERQIQQALSISVPSVVHHILQRLEGAELLTIIRYSRGYRSQLIPTEAGEKAAQLWQEGQDADQGETTEE
jgi:SOS-response transcriptional repressor LexA